MILKNSKALGFTGHAVFLYFIWQDQDPGIQLPSCCLLSGKGLIESSLSSREYITQLEELPRTGKKWIELGADPEIGSHYPGRKEHKGVVARDRTFRGLGSVVHASAYSLVSRH